MNKIESNNKSDELASSLTRNRNNNIEKNCLLDLSLDNDIFDVEGLKADSVNMMNFLLNGSLLLL